VLQRARQVLARIEANSQISLEPALPRASRNPAQADGALAA
jgi:hypothetical protein